MQVQQPVGKRGAHLVGDGAVLGGVAGGDDEDAVGQAVPADAALLQEAVDRGLEPGRGGGQLVEEEHRRAAGLVGQVLGTIPERLLRGVVVIGQAAQVLRLDGGEAQVEEPRADPVGELLDHLGLADAGAAVQHPGDGHAPSRCAAQPASSTSSASPAETFRALTVMPLPRLRQEG
jgi:hypothetical protein